MAALLYQRPGRGIPLNMSGPSQPSGVMAKRVLAVLLGLAITVVARGPVPHGPGPDHGRVAGGRPAPGVPPAAPADHRRAGGMGDAAGRRADREPARPGPGRSCRIWACCVLLAAFAVANSVLRTAAQRRLSQVRAVARVAQSALLREVPATVTAGRMASRYVSAAAEARVGGDILEVVSEGGRTALAHRGHARQGTAGGAPGQRRDDQLPGRLRPAGLVADRDRPGGGPVGHAGRGRGGLRDRVVRRVRPARLA